MKFPPEIPEEPRKIIMITRIIYFSLSFLLLIAGAVFLSLGGWIKYSEVKAYLDQFSYRGGVDYFTKEYYEGVIGRARIAGAGLLCLGLIFLAMARWLLRHVENFMAGLKEDVRILWRWLMEPDDKANWIIKPLFWLIMIGGIGIRLYFIDQPVRADEARTFTAYAFRPFMIIASDWTAPNNQILHTILVRVCYLLVGDNLLALRFPAFFFGIMFMPVVYIFGKKYYNITTGLMLMAYVAIAFPMVVWSTMGRGYTLLFCLSYALFTLGIYLRHYPENRGAWMGAFLCVVLGFFTMPSMLYTVMAFGLWMSVMPLTSSDVKIRFQWWFKLLGFAVISGLAVLLLYAPAFVATDWSKIADDATLVGGQSWSQIQIELKKMTSGLWRQFLLNPVWLTPLIFIAGLLGCFTRHPRCKSQGALWLFAWSIALFVPIMVQKTVPYDRTYHVFLPLVYALPISGVSWFINRIKLLWRNILLVVAIVIMMVFPLWHWRAYYPERLLKTGDHFTGAESTVIYLQNHAREGDIVISCVPAPGPMVYYAKKHGFDLRVWDLLQYTPELVKGTNVAWVVVHTEYNHTADRYFYLLGVSDWTRAASLSYSSEHAEIYRVDCIELNGFRYNY